MAQKQLKDRRLQLMLTEEEEQQVQEYRWANRINSMSDAVRQLIAKGLESKKAETVSTIPAA